jgi:hypothetical protein
MYILPSYGLGMNTFLWPSSAHELRSPTTASGSSFTYHLLASSSTPTTFIIRLRPRLSSIHLLIRTGFYIPHIYHYGRLLPTRSTESLPTDTRASVLRNNGYSKHSRGRRACSLLEKLHQRHARGAPRARAGAARARSAWEGPSELDADEGKGARAARSDDAGERGEHEGEAGGVRDVIIVT